MRGEIWDEGDIWDNKISLRIWDEGKYFRWGEIFKMRGDILDEGKYLSDCGGEQIVGTFFCLCFI